MSRGRRVGPLVLILACVAPVRVRSEPLGPEHLLLLFNRKIKASGELALYYAEKRGVPRDHLVALDVPQTDDLTRAAYEAQIVRVLRRHLEASDPNDQIRCLVTFTGIPIRVGPLVLTPRRRETAAALARRYGAVQAELETLIETLDRAGTGRDEATPSAAASRARGRDRVASLDRLLQRYEVHRDSAARRILRLKSAETRAAAQRSVMQLIAEAEGQAGTLRYLQIRDDLPEAERTAAEAQRRAVQQVVRSVKRRIDALLAAGLDAPERDEARKLIRQNNGLVGLLAHLDVDQRRLKTDQTQAALDSELSLLLWDDYPLHAWTPNALWVRNARGATQRAVNERVLMVSRLDGPSPAVVRRIIDESLAVERRGLTGTCYIDARGLSAKDSYGAYDRKLRDLARFLQSKTALDVTLDKRPALFAPRACPQTALYCGWYSLANYVDAFDFVPGAVGFHVASSEAVSLRAGAKRYWCKELLRDGVAATLGPVAEPYLHAFPDPRDFFGLLLTGQLTLVECFYHSTPMNSWMMLLVADPLYRPFAANPQLALDDVFDEDVSFPLAPATQPESGQ